MRFMTCAMVLATTLLSGLPAQDTAKGLLELAGKKAATAKGRTADEAAAILKDAAGMYEQVATRFPAAKAEGARSHLEVGRIRRKLNDLPGAEAALKEASLATEEPRIATEALHDLASVYRKTKRLPEAQQALERIVAEFASEPRQRAEALSRLASLHRAAKRMDAAEAALRQILADHGDLFSHAIDALDDLVVLKIGQGREAEARSLHASHGEALKARFNGTRYESRVQPALDRIATRFKLAEDDDE
jgi:tetratricopeptide (TPR) repeat protein